jgi:tetratricopeptide (TPR) repeat protein
MISYRYVLIFITLLPLSSCCQIDKGNINVNKANNNSTKDDALKLIGNASSLIVNCTNPLSYQERLDLNVAIKLLDSAIAIDSAIISAYINKSQALRLLDKNHEALQTINYVIQIDPNFEEAYTSKGFIYEKLGKHDSANIEYKKSIQTYKNNMIYYNDMKKKNALINIAILESFLDYEKGLMQINFLIEKNKEDSELKIMKKIWFDDFNRKEFINNF